jgi:hypothetical protein
VEGHLGTGTWGIQEKTSAQNKSIKGIENHLDSMICLYSKNHDDLSIAKRVGPVQRTGIMHNPFACMYVHTGT